MADLITLIVTLVIPAGGLFWKYGRDLPPTERDRLLSHFLVPATILTIATVLGGGLSIGFEKGIAISELRTEVNGNAGLAKRGVVVIAEPSTYEYVVPLTQVTSVWSSLADRPVADNIGSHLELIPSGLRLSAPFVGVAEPIALVVEGEVGKSVIMVGAGEEPIEDFQLSSRRSLTLVIGVLFNCTLALGIGIAVGFPPVKPQKDNTSEVGTEPDEEGVINGHAVNSKTSKVWIRPRSKTNRKKIPRVDQ